MKDASRLLRKLRRKVYREVPIATWNRAAEVDWRGSYHSLISTFRRGDCGVLSGGAALALWRAATDAGFRAWCYDFGFPESLTHMVTVVELDGRLRVHDPFLNLGYRADFHEILEGLRADQLPDIRCETRDRKIYVMDPSCESQLTADWLTAHADRELDRVGSLRRFEVLWDRDALLATLAGPKAVYRELETRGYPADLSYLMLHPIGVFDGRAHHQNPETMPLIGGRDLRSPVAGLRAAMQQLTQDLAVERDQLAEKSAISGRLESELAEARSQLLAASGEAERLSAQAAQLRAALDDSSRQWVAEREALSQGNSALEERRAVLEAELAEARARHAAATEEVRRLADQVLQLRSAYDDAERLIATERELFLQQQQKLEAALGETSSHAAEIEAQAQRWEQTIRTLQDAAGQRTAEWEAERLVSQTAAQALEDDKQRLRAEVTEAGEDLATAQGQIAKMRDTLARRISEWGDERRSLQETAHGLEDDKRQLQAEVAEAREDLTTAQGQIAEMHDTLDRRAAEWDGERRSLQETAHGLEDDKRQLQAEVAEAREDLTTAQGQIAEMHDTLDRRAAEWDGERRSLQETAHGLEDDKRQLQAEVAEAREDLTTAQGQIAEMHDTLDRRATEWDGERRSLQETAHGLEDDKRQLQAEVAEAREDLTTAQGQIAEMHDTLDRRATEWDGERRSLQETAHGLEDDKQQLHAEVLEAWEDLAKAHRRLRDVENQAAWSGLQIAELVEKDAAAVSELAQCREEIAVLGTRVVALQSELGSAEVELVRRDAEAEEFVAAAKRLLAVDALPSTDLSAVLGELRQQLRKTERELDRVEADRDRLQLALTAPEARKRPTAGRFGTFLRRLLARTVDHREKPNPLSGTA